MPQSLGARLRQRREERRISLATIAEHTKISASLLDAMERGDVRHWPSGIFRRAFIRSYAEAIGLDADAIVREFLERYPDPLEEAGLAWPDPPANGTADGRPAVGLRAAIGSLFGRGRRAAQPIWPGGLRLDPPVDAFRAPDPQLAAARATLDPVETVRDALSDIDALTGAAAASRPAEPAREADLTLTLGATEETDAPVEAPRATVAAPPATDDAATRTAGRRPAESRPPAADLEAAAQLCTALSRTEDPVDAQPLLGEAARILNALGLVVWVWDARAAELRPALTHGYPDRVVAQLPRVRRDADNPTAAAFRVGEPCVVDGGDRASGALVVPILTGGGCVGVLAIEVRPGHEQQQPVQALATIFAAQLARLVALESSAAQAGGRRAGAATGGLAEARVG
jgi:transcriptional regulator with XRE-family HTH domain